MKNVNPKPKCLLLTAMVIALVSVSSLCAEEKSWKDETVLISPQGGQTVVRPLEGDKILFKNADPQLAIEWGMANARTTLVLAGKYVVSDAIDIPRDDITLIIGQGAEISLNPDTEHKADIGFKSRRHPNYWQIVPLVWNRGHDNVRVIHLGTMVRSVWDWGDHGKQTSTIVFDGRNEKRTCGVEGGLLLVAAPVRQGACLVDSRGVQIPLMVPGGTLGLEGCENCKIGTLFNLAPKPGGTTGETVDLNSSNRGITIERLIAERPHEIIDMNGSHADVKEIVCIGEPNKLLCFTVRSGPRHTDRPACPDRLDVWKANILEDVADVRRRIEVPKLPDALPRFTVKATVEVTLKDGSKKVYTKEVEIDVRSAE